MVPFSFHQTLLKSRVMKIYISSFLAVLGAWNWVILPRFFILHSPLARPGFKVNQASDLSQFKPNQGGSSQQGYPIDGSDHQL